MRLAPATADAVLIRRPGLLRRLRPAAAALTLSLAGCGPSRTTPAPHVELHVTPSPPAVGPATIAVAVRGVDGEPVAGASLRLEAHMTHPGMRPVLADAVERASGTYVAPLTLTMAGEWVILVKGRLADGTPIDFRFDLGRVEPGP